MLIHIDFDVAGDRQLSRAFEGTAREAEDMSEPLGEFGRLLLREIGEQFLTEGARGGTPWQRLSRAYAAWKEEHFPGRPLLVLTGAMRAKATTPQAVRVEPRRMVYELDDEKGIWHQQGRGANPARPIVEVNQDARRQVDRIFANWLNGVRRGAGIGM